MIWTIDFVADQCMDIYVVHGVKGDQVVEVLESIQIKKGIVQKKKRLDNGSEFISKGWDKWVYNQSVILDFSRLGIPTANAYIEPFNGCFRDVCLNTNCSSPWEMLKKY